jgi:hypothetical protein
MCSFLLSRCSLLTNDGTPSDPTHPQNPYSRNGEDVVADDMVDGYDGVSGEEHGSYPRASHKGDGEEPIFCVVIALS